MRRDGMLSSLWRVLRYLGWYAPLYVPGVILLSLQNTLINAALAKILRLVVDVGPLRGEFPLDAIAPVLGSVLVYLLLILIGFLMFASAIAMAEKALRSDVFRRVVRAEAGVLLGRHSGEWVTMVTQHPVQARQAIDFPLVMFLMGILGPISATIICMRVNVRLTLLPLAAGLIVFAFNMWCAPRIKRVVKERLPIAERATARLLDLYQGYAVVRAFGIAARITERFMAAAREQRDNYLRQCAYESARQFAMVAAITTIEPIIVLLGMTMVARGAAVVGDVVEVATLSGAIVWSLSNVAQAYTDLIEKLASVERVTEAIDLPQEKLEGEAVALGAETVVDVRDAVFAYPSRPDDPVLKGLTFSLHSGDTLALVGPSGGGKSTIIKLLLRLYECGGGSIDISGTPITDLGVDALRARFALVPQMPHLFDGSVLSNIELGRPGASREDIMAAARLAHADDFIRALPDGYDTRVGERGAQLSGGQCQRIAIARAFLKDAPVLLLDEATAALDGVSEAAVQQGLSALMKGRTVLLVAHRLSTARGANRILYIAEGEVKESGSHDQLIAKNGLYAAMWRAQTAVAVQ